MNRILSVFAFLTLTVAARADVAGDEQTLKQLNADIQAAVVAENLSFLEGVLHQDYVHTRPNGVIWDRAGFLASVNQDHALPNVNYDKLTTTDIRVHLYGDAAVLTGRSGLKSDGSQGTLTGETCWTRVFVRQDGRWKAVAFQATMAGK
ncbi:MAG: nuclear transport factor 2 family protein [Planctomycetia bacterium]